MRARLTKLNYKIQNTHNKMNRINTIINSISKEFYLTFATDAQLLLFGSRANNTHNVYSDIDLAIQYEGELNQKKVHQFYDFVDNFPTLYSIDLVDIKHTSKAFKQQIKDNSVTL